MDIGMLWMDDGQGRDLASRVKEAVASYKAQYGVAPSVCMVSEGELQQGLDEVAGLRLEGSKRLLPNYFWIGRAAELEGT